MRRSASSRPSRGVWRRQALVPLDGSPLAEAAIPYTLELLRACEDGQGATLHLTYVLDPKQAYHAGIAETEAMHEERTYLESISARITADPAWHSIAVTSRVEPGANVVMGIERVGGARRQPARGYPSLRGDGNARA
ncbi:MAG TPA: universal stress protein [Ktedonobacterales bacterium]